MRSVCTAAQLATLLATPSGEDAGEWITNKIKGEVVEAAAIGATGFATNELKSATARERPNGADSESFPSGHSSIASVHAELAIYNLESVDMSPGWKSTATIGIRAAAFGTAWARVEGGWHYPSDTLAGMALGNFLASFATRAFMGDQAKSLSLSMTDGGAMVEWNVSF